MAKKVKTPPPPRKVQAPKRRHDPRPPVLDRQRLQWLLGVTTIAAIAVAIALAVVLTRQSSGGNDAKVAKAMAAAGCTFRSVIPLPPKQDIPSGYHLDSPTLTSKVKWATFPPSAGAHFPVPALWGFYRQPVNPRQVVHNEEHSGVILWWGPKVSNATIDQLYSFYKESPDAMLGTPIAGLGKKIAITAWTGDPSRYYSNGYHGVGHIGTCTSFNQNAFTTFRDEYRGKGPERFPIGALTPGT